MAQSDVIELVAEEYTQKDQNGVAVPQTVSRQVYCKVTSATQTEFFGGGRNGLNPAYKFTVFSGDYQEEPTVRYKGRAYAVYRTYLVPGTDRIELHTERRGGRNGIQDAGRQAL